MGHGRKIILRTGAAGSRTGDQPLVGKRRRRSAGHLSIEFLLIKSWISVNPTQSVRNNLPSEPECCAGVLHPGKMGRQTMAESINPERAENLEHRLQKNGTIAIMHRLGGKFLVL